MKLQELLNNKNVQTVNIYLLCYLLKGGFLSAIVSLGLLIALAMTPHDGKNQAKRMGKCTKPINYLLAVSLFHKYEPSLFFFRYPHGICIFHR